MFNESWIRLAVLMLLLGAALGQDALLVLPALLLTMIPIAWAWQRLAFWRLRYERRLDETRVFAGETTRLTTRLSNQKWLPLAWVRVNERVPLAVAPLERPLSPSHLPLMGDLELRASLTAFERARWTFTLQCNRRGYFTLGPARLQSGDLFGLFARELVWPDVQRLIVYPRLRPLEDWGLPPKEPFGDTTSRRRLFGDPSRVYGIRDYLPGDPPKQIHWPATARRGELQVKLPEPTINYTWMLVLNISTFENAWEGIDPAKAEQAISLAASLAAFAAEHKHAVGILANGSWPESDQRLKVLPGRGPEQLRHVLEALAAVSYFVTSSVEALLAAEASQLPWGATLVIVTPLVTAGLVAEVERLALVGRKMVLVSLDEKWTPRDMPGVVVRQAAAFGAETVPVEGQGALHV